MDSMVEPENPRSEVIGRVGSSERGLRDFPAPPQDASIICTGKNSCDAPASVPEYLFSSECFSRAWRIKIRKRSSESH